MPMMALTRALAALIVAGAGVSGAGAQTTWDMPTNYAAGSFHNKNIDTFAADVEKETNGSLKIAVHPAGKLFKHAEIKPAVRDGKAPIGEILESLASAEAPVYGLDSVPFLTSGYDSAKKLYAAQKPYLEKQLASEGLMLLFSVPWPPQGIYAKREIKSADDLKGLKFRSYNAMTARIATLAGAVPTQIEVPDLPAAFASGRVDVMMTSASSGVESKAESYLSYYIDTQAWQPRNIVFVNKAAFDKLPAAEQTALRDAAATAEALGWQMSLEEMKIKTDALKAAKITVVPPTPELKAGLTRIGETIAAEWEKSAGADGAAILAAYRK
jgi:TRAP-type C4-dicarboxylate transport system substrate-binding protein